MLRQTPVLPPAALLAAVLLTSAPGSALTLTSADAGEVAVEVASDGDHGDHDEETS